MKHKINTEGTSFFYDMEFDYKIHLEKKIVLLSTDALNYVNQKYLSNICRPVITQHYSRNTFMVDYMFWFQETDLKTLDTKIEKKEYADKDFKYSVKTQFVRQLKCWKCNSVFENALVIELPLVYPENFKLGKQKMDLIRNLNKFKVCPNCNTTFTLNVLFIFPNTTNIIHSE